jgi:hypothetical protein
MKRIVFVFSFLVNYCFAQYAPAVGVLGTSAVYKDSSGFVFWANKAIINRGPMDISNPTIGIPNVGSEIDALGKADGYVVSLGDGGEAILTFAYPISNGKGADFAVFENSFNATFLELAFVEVSSDGVNFIRFPNFSLTDTLSQLGNDAVMYPEKLHNLAGKYPAKYGTPFDLEDVKDSLLLDVSKITHVKIIDVVGSIDPMYGTRDSKGSLINDPFPTPFPNAGFDLDAVGVIHSNSLGLVDLNLSKKVFPNPSNGIVMLKDIGFSEYQCVNSEGILLFEFEFFDSHTLDLNFLPRGMYFLMKKSSNDKPIRISLI